MIENDSQVEHANPELRTIPINNFWLGLNVHAEYGTSGSIQNAAAPAGLVLPFNCLQFGGKTAWTPTNIMTVAQPGPGSEAYGYLGQGAAGVPGVTDFGDMQPRTAAGYSIDALNTDWVGPPFNIYAAVYIAHSYNIYPARRVMVEAYTGQQFVFVFDGTAIYATSMEGGQPKQAEFYSLLQAHNGRQLPLRIYQL